jgi:hypothetical protein
MHLCVRDGARVRLLSALAGAIPSQIGRLARLRQLNFHDNQLTGALHTHTHTHAHVNRADEIARSYPASGVVGFAYIGLLVREKDSDTFVLCLCVCGFHFV